DQAIVLTRGARRRAGLRSSRRRAARPSFAQTMAALESLSAGGAQVSVHVADLDSGATVVSGDDSVVMPVGGLGVVPLLVEVAARFEDGTLDPRALVRRDRLERVSVSGIWRHLAVEALPLGDLAVLAAAQGDAYATNGLLE